MGSLFGRVVNGSVFADIFNLDLDVGLFREVWVRAGSGKPPVHADRIIFEEPFSRDVYGPPLDPGPEDYYVCPGCGETHLRECFEDAPQVLGQEHFMRYYVELPHRGGYARKQVSSKDFTVEKNTVFLPELVWTNKAKWTWTVSGLFYVARGKLFAHELFAQGNITLDKDCTVKIRPNFRSDDG